MDKPYVRFVTKKLFNNQICKILITKTRRQKMEVIGTAIQTVGTYVFQVGEGIVVGTSNTLVTLGSGTVDVLKALFQGIGLG